VTPDPTQTAADLNTVAHFLAASTETPPTPLRVARSVGVTSVDLIILLGNSVLCTTEAVATAIRNGVTETVLIVGGEGHSTPDLRSAVRADPQFEGQNVEGRAEADILRDLLVQGYDLPEAPFLTETQSTNCGANAEEAHALCRERGLRPTDVLLVQDPTMQRRTWASFRRVWGAERPPRFYNCPTFVPRVEAEAGTLVFEQPERAGLWSMERFVSLVMGEIPRLRNDEDGYGPNGRGYIVAVDVPPAVEAAYDRLLGPFGDLVRAPGGP